MTSTGNVGIDVDHVYAAGRSIAGRAAHGGHHARGLRDAVEAATAVVGDPDIAAALREVHGEILDPVAKLPALVTAIGHDVSGTAVTARTQDEKGAQDLRTHVATAQSAASGLLRSINVDPAL
ncbi:MAG TPA: hypothetical protein VN088_03175 [Nocardioides sp.]|nr:hypothetical protein [Nocardioides sp.]